MRVLYFKQLYRRLIFRLSASNHFLYLSFYKFLYVPPRNSISAFLDLYSRNTEDFQVIQIGANDGITHDPIHKFIKRDSWSGVLLEPQKRVYHEFLEPIYSLDKGITTLNAALGTKNGVGKIFKIGFSNARWASGLTSFNRKVLEKAFTSGHVARQLEKENRELPNDPSTHIVEEKITIICPNTLLKTYDIENIDLLQIDTEGFDYEIIKIFDIGQTQPAAIIYENIHLTDEDQSACTRHLKGHQYLVKNFGGNTLAVHKNTDILESIEF